VFALSSSEKSQSTFHSATQAHMAFSALPQGGDCWRKPSLMVSFLF